MKEPPCSTPPAPTTAILNPPKSLFTFEMDPHARAESAPKTKKASEAFSNTRVEVNLNQKGKAKSKKEQGMGNGGESGDLDAEIKRPVSKEEKRQRIASWRADLPSLTKGCDAEKRPPRDFSGPLKHLIEDTLEGGGIAIHGKAHSTTAHNDANNAFNDPTSSSSKAADMDANIFDQNVANKGEPEAWTSTQMKAYLTHLKYEQGRSADPSFTPYDDAIRTLYTAEDEPGFFDDREHGEYHAKHQRVSDRGNHSNQSHVEEMQTRTLYGSPPPASTYLQQDLNLYSSPGPSNTHCHQNIGLHSSSGPSNPPRTRAAPVSTMHSPYQQSDAQLPCTTQTQYAPNKPTNMQETANRPSISQMVTPMPPPGYHSISEPLPGSTPRYLTPQTIQKQRRSQLVLREETPKPPPYVHGVWPESRDLQAGVPANPMTWEELVALRRAEDELRTTGSVRGPTGAGGIGTGNWNGTIAAFGQQHTQSSDAHTRIRDSGDRNFRDTYWERTLRPTSETWAYDARFDRTKAQHVCRCTLCQRMGKWFADPKAAQLAKESPSRESLRALSLVGRLVD